MTSFKGTSSLRRIFCSGVLWRKEREGLETSARQPTEKGRKEGHAWFHKDNRRKHVEKKRPFGVSTLLLQFHCSDEYCSQTGPLLYRFSVIVVFDGGPPCFRNFNNCYWSWARCQIFLFLERHTNEAKLLCRWHNLGLGLGLGLGLAPFLPLYRSPDKEQEEKWRGQSTGVGILYKKWLFSKTGVASLAKKKNNNNCADKFY